MQVSTKFRANRSKNMATGAKKPPKITYYDVLVHIVTFFTSWNFCSHTMHLHHLHVSTKFEANQSKNIVTVAKNVISPPFATQHQNLDIKLYHYTHLYHTYHVSKFEKDQLSNKKIHITCMLKANTLLTVRAYSITFAEHLPASKHLNCSNRDHQTSCFYAAALHALYTKLPLCLYQFLYNTI